MKFKTANLMFFDDVFPFPLSSNDSCDVQNPLNLVSRFVNHTMYYTLHMKINTVTIMILNFH